MAKKWIQAAHLKKGAFSAYAHRNHLSMAAAITKGRHSRNATTKRRANLANTFRKMSRRHKKK